MHKIIWDLGMVSILTNSIDSSTHKHWMLQLFFNPDGNIDLTVNGLKVSGKCILVNTNCKHTFSTSNDLHFSILIIPGSYLCEYLENTFIKKSEYYDFSTLINNKIIIAFEKFKENPNLNTYIEFRDELIMSWGVQTINTMTETDTRIQEIIQKLTKDVCDIDSSDTDRSPPSIENLANEAFLSPSRLAHLFKEKTGIPLKSYLVFIKVYNAFKMLLNGTSITSSALNAGFDSSSHLAMTVKGMMGTSASLAIKDSEFLKVPLKSSWYSKLNKQTD